MKSSLPTLIIISVISIVEAADPKDAPLCCGNTMVHLEDNYNAGNWTFECENGAKILLPCNSTDMVLLNYGWKEFIYDTDDDGRQIYVDGFTIVHSPYYCSGNSSTTYVGERWKFVACSSQIIGRNRPVFKQISVTIIALLFMVSGIFLALTAVIYFFIPQTQDVEGKCTFHLTLNESLMYLLGAYWCLRINTMEITFLEEFCISYWYLFIFALLSFFVWSSVLAFHIWSRFRNNSRTDESKLMRPYLIIGYGIPFLLVIISNIHVYGFSQGDFGEVSCSTHRYIMFLLYAALPILITQVISSFFFIRLQRQLWQARPTNSTANSISNLRKFKFRFLLNAKLFILTGLPCLLMVACIFINAFVFRSSLIGFLIIAIFFFIACEGVVVFCMLVVFRKRILKGIAGMFGVTLAGWEACPESEESLAYSNQNELGREL